MRAAAVGIVLAAAAAACGGEPGPSADAAVVPVVDAGIDAGQLAAPSVLASDGLSPHEVEVSWTAVSGALLYYVYRDGVRIAITDETSYVDGAAGPPGPPSQPLDVFGTEDLLDRVEVTWSHAAVSFGAFHDYLVRAFNDAGPGLVGPPDSGFRAGLPVLGYEISIDFDGVWIPLGLATVFEDHGAPPPELFVGTTFASQGTSPTAVTLFVSAFAQPTHRQYQVRAHNVLGTGPEALAFGARGAGPLTFQWQRSAADSNADYSDIPGGNVQSFSDVDAPADGSGRWYRCRVSAPGAGTSTSVPRRGFRVVTPPP